MKPELHPPDEIRIIAPSELGEEYAVGQRNLLIDFFRANTGVMVRVTTELRMDESIVEQEQVKVLSKAEMLEAMIQKNPLLGQLKDALNLQLEY